MLERLTTEQRNPASASIDALPTTEILGIINAEDGIIAAAVGRAREKTAAAVDAVVAALHSGGRLIYIGAGTSGRLGVLDASEIPPTYGAPPDLVQGIIAGGESALARSVESCEDSEAAGVADVVAKGLSSRDALVGIAASGRTPYVLGAVRYARSIGATTIGLSCVAGAELSAAVQYPIEVETGPEVVTGSTRMKAGTATKLVLNMLSTAAMIRMGYVYGNLMVNVQARNFKLVERARRIVCEIAGVSAERAASLLDEAGMQVRTAVVMARLNVDRAEAERRLAEAGGVLRRVIG